MRKRIPRQLIEVSIQLRLAVLSLSNTKQRLETLRIERSRITIHDRVQRAVLQLAVDSTSNHAALTETVIQVNDQQRWLFAVVDPETNEILHARLFSARTAELTVLFLRELRRKRNVEEATFLGDNDRYLKVASARLDLRFRTTYRGSRNSEALHAASSRRSRERRSREPIRTRRVLMTSQTPGTPSNVSLVR